MADKAEKMDDKDQPKAGEKPPVHAPDKATGPGPDMEATPTEESAHQAAERRAVDREMAHQERIDDTGSQGFGRPDAAPRAPESPGTRYPMNVESTEAIVDTTHWPEPFRNMMAQSVRCGECLTHEGKDYEILMGTGGDYVLVTEVGDAATKPVYLIRLPHEGEQQASA